MRLLGREAVDTIAMLLGLAFGFATVGFSFEDWLPYNQYSHTGNLHVVIIYRFRFRFLLIDHYRDREERWGRV